MSFITKVKDELINKTKKNLNKNNSLSFLLSLFKTCGEINLNTNSLNFITNNENIYELVNICLEKLNLDPAELEIDDELTIKNNIKYKIFLNKSASKVLLDEFIYKTDLNFNENIIKDDENKKTFLKGLFLIIGTGNITINSENNGYLVEFVFNDNDFSLLVLELLSNFDIFAKKVNRRGQFVVYINKFDTICDLFALFGLNNSVLELNNENVLRNVRNNVNRQSNCFESNMNKTISASMKQLDAINFIDSTIGINSLPIELQEVCLCRLANKEESLDNLVKLLNNKISKSGLNHRLNKIIKIAEELKGKF